MSGDGGRTRAAAARVVDGVVRDGRPFERAFREAVPDRFSDRDLSQIKALSLGALRWHHRHRIIIGNLLERPLRSRDSILEALLSVGLFQLIDERQPAYAVVSATVAATRPLKQSRAAGLINASLRRFQRERDSLLAQCMASEEGRFSHPQWLIDRLRDDWPDEWANILDASLSHPPLWLRVNTRKVAIEDYARRLEAELDIETFRLPGFPDALRLAQSVDVDALPGFRDGLVSVQDAAAQLAADLLAPEPGMRVLDACAAPGGKAGHLLERCSGDLDLLALDRDRERNDRTADNLSRLGFAANIVTADARDTKRWSGGAKFDRILLDAPCSATGVMRRHPDIKYLRRADDFANFAKRQRDLLEALWPLLEAGGRMLYATCSVMMIENNEVVDGFMRVHSDAHEVRPLRDDVLQSVHPGPGPGPGYQLLPADGDTDGFYYALMERQT